MTEKNKTTLFFAVITILKKHKRMFIKTESREIYIAVFALIFDLRYFCKRKTLPITQPYTVQTQNTGTEGGTSAN